MKQTADVYTVDAFIKPGRGRPRDPNAKSNAQRQKEWRQRRKFNCLNSVTRNGNSSSNEKCSHPNGWECRICKPEHFRHG